MFDNEDEQLKRIEDEINVSDELQNEVADLQSQQPQEQQNPALTLQDLMAKYNNLRKARETATSDQGDIAKLQGANQIAQAIASGRGAKIGAGEEGVRALQNQAKARLEASEGDFRDAGTALGMEKSIQGLEVGELDVEHEKQMADPNSDISKFMREQAYALMKERMPNSPLLNQLDKMSARQLQKLGFKGPQQQSQVMPWSFTDRVTADGTPVKVNRSTGAMYNALTNEILPPNTVTYRDVARKDAVTGQYGYMNAQTGMTVPGLGSVNNPEARLSTQAGVETAMPGTEGAKPPQPKYADFIRQAPEQDKAITKLKEQMLKDVTDAREVATSVASMRDKLSMGDVSGIDSGLLGGIATQAARMAGQKGVLTDKDLEKFGGAGGRQAAANRWLQNGLTGKMTPEDIEFFKTFESKMSDSVARDIENRSQIFTDQAKQRVQAIYPDIDDKTIRQWLSVDKIAPEVQKVTSSNEGLVERKTSDGKIGLFDPKTKQFVRWKE